MLSERFLRENFPNIFKMASEAKEVTQVDEEAAQQAQPQPERRPTHPLLTAGKVLGAYGAGTAAGYGGLLGANALSKSLRGGQPLINKMGPAMHAIPALAGIGTVAFTHAQNSLFDRMRADEERRREMRGG
jgi:hypothetical protein